MGILIEISPFRNCTGAACFNWQRVDEILRGVNDDIVFRLNKISHPQIDDLVEANWEERWWADTDPEPYWTLYDGIIQNEDAQMQQQKQKHLSLQLWIFAMQACIVAAVLSYDGFWGKLSFIALILTMVSAHFGYLKIFESVSSENELNAENVHLSEIRQLDEKRLNEETIALFVYGTLKRNFHWNHKFMSRAGAFIGNAKTIKKYPLVMGDCNVPYVIDLDVDEQN